MIYRLSFSELSEPDHITIGLTSKTLCSGDLNQLKNENGYANRSAVAEEIWDFVKLEDPRQYCDMCRTELFRLKGNV